MSPFSKLIGDLRKSRGVRQSKLAEAVGFEQSYISALEAGTKGPPSSEFVEKMNDFFNLNEHEQEMVACALSKSSRKFNLPIDAHQSLYELCYELKKSSTHLQPQQIEIVTNVLRLLNQVNQENAINASK